MWKNTLKKYGKIVSAAGFLTVAGLCYGCAGSKEQTVVLTETSAAETGVGTVISDPIYIEETELSETEAALCFVHICGEVKEPGVYELPEGSRLFEAVEAAGGFTKEASEESLNLAGLISDGMQIVIRSKEEAASSAAAANEQAAGLININQASKEQLMTLPGIGESRAEDIIRYREQSGGFQTIEEIMKVSGIKDAAFQKIKERIVV